MQFLCFSLYANYKGKQCSSSVITRNIVLTSAYLHLTVRLVVLYFAHLILIYLNVLGVTVLINVSISHLRAVTFLRVSHSAFRLRCTETTLENFDLLSLPVDVCQYFM